MILARDLIIVGLIKVNFKANSLHACALTFGLDLKKDTLVYLKRNQAGCNLQ